MYDIDDSPYNRLLIIQCKAQSKYGVGSRISDLMDTVLEYWADQDDDPPSIMSEELAYQVAEAVSDMTHHLCKEDRKPA